MSSNLQYTSYFLNMKCNAFLLYPSAGDLLSPDSLKHALNGVTSVV